MEITKLITEKYSLNLDKIIILNNYYTELIYNIFKPILNKRLTSILHFTDNENDIKNIL